MTEQWNKAQEWESSWWDSCVNTYGEEEKQLLYADRMGLKFFHNRKSPYNIDMHGCSVLDVGGGPVSLLLKCVNLGRGVVVDPLEVPQWVVDRYSIAGISLFQTPAEDMYGPKMGIVVHDEAWIYNCLQHAQDPEKIIFNAKNTSKLVRVFEWLDTGTNEGHPHEFKNTQLNEWLGGEGKVELLNGEAQCYGKCYYGIFPTEHYGLRSLSDE